MSWLVLRTVKMDDTNLRVLGFHPEKLIVLLDCIRCYYIHTAIFFGRKYSLFSLSFEH